MATVEQRPTPHFTRGRGGALPQLIIVHTNVGSVASTVTWFADPDSGVSSHYLVALDGALVRFVDEEDIASHAGRVLRPTAELVVEQGGNPNHYSIGIEFEDGGQPLDAVRPDAQYESGSRLISEIARRWRIPLDCRHLVGHREVYAAKDCPGNLDVERLLSDARTL